MIRKQMGAFIAACAALACACPCIATAAQRRYCGNVNFLDVTGVPSRDKVYLLRGRISCRQARSVDFEAETSYFLSVPGWRCGWPHDVALVCANRRSTVKGVPVEFAPAAPVDTVFTPNP